MKQPEGIQPGIYENMSDEDYHNDPALGSSGLKTLLCNPQKFWYESRALNPKYEGLDTKACKNGRAIHTLLFQETLFDAQFTIKEGKESSTMEGVLGEGEYDSMVKSVDVIRNHPRFSRLIIGGKAEISIFWRDKETGVMCKVRFDYLTQGSDAWGIDYKSTNADIWDVRSVSRTITKYGYDISASMYLEGMQKAGLGDHSTFMLLFQQKKPPYIPRTLLLDKEILDTSYPCFRKGLELYKYNIEKYGTTKWASGIDDVECVTLDDLPSWHIDDRTF